MKHDLTMCHVMCHMTDCSFHTLGCGHVLVHQIKIYIDSTLAIETTKVPTS